MNDHVENITKTAMELGDKRCSIKKTNCWTLYDRQWRINNKEQWTIKELRQWKVYKKECNGHVTDKEKVKNRECNGHSMADNEENDEECNGRGMADEQLKKICNGRR